VELEDIRWGKMGARKASELGEAAASLPAWAAMRCEERIAAGERVLIRNGNCEEGFAFRRSTAALAKARA
jgi:hypothetical protein